MDSFTIALMRGVTSIRAVTNFDNESGEVCLRMAEELVQWSFGLMPHAINGEAIFESMLMVRDGVREQIEQSMQRRRGRPEKRDFIVNHENNEI